MKKSVLFMLVFTLSGCSAKSLEVEQATASKYSNLTDEQFISEAEDGVKYSVIDPTSVLMRNQRIVRTPDNHRVLCLDVNSKNKFGGYVGFQSMNWYAGTLYPNNNVGLGLGETIRNDARVKLCRSAGQ